MATVYLADDLKHERKVALKVLKPELAAVVGAERFLAEIKTTANLQHPNILPLFDSGEADGFLFYVMPHVDGENLRDRLEREKQLPVAEAVRIATEVAEALHSAHEHGVVHRDVKPANIMVSQGRPLVADFGIALAVSAAGGSRLTETGLSLGTPHYMSPEQATGDQVVGPPSDVYSLACVLYEMLVGEPPHTGSTAQAILGRVITSDPESVTSQRRQVPKHVDAVVSRALEKLPADRFSSADEFAKALGDESFRYGSAVGAVAPARLKLWTIAGWAAAAALGGLWMASVSGPDPLPDVRWLSLSVTDWAGASEWMELTPDGSALILSAEARGATQNSLVVRRLDDLSSMPIPGSNSAAHYDPTVSPDGEMVAFGSDNGAYVAPIAGGSVRTLVTEGIVCCLRWGDDGYVYFSNEEAEIYRVRAAGGEPERLFASEAEEQEEFVYYEPIPGQERAVISLMAPSSRIEIVDTRSGRREVLTDGMKPFVTESGYLVFVREGGRLFAAKLDAEAMVLTGDPVLFVEGVGIIPGGRDAMFTLSESGDLAYWARPTAVPVDVRELIWVDRAGQIESVDTSFTGEFESVELSPSGDRAAVTVGELDRTEVWIKELNDGPARRLTNYQGMNRRPVWSPDGTSLAFISDRGGRRAGYRVPVDRIGVPELFLEHEGEDVDEVFWPTDGEWWIYRTGTTFGTTDVYARRLQPDTVTIAVSAQPEVDERAPVLSPNNRWIAYKSDQSGQDEIWVRPFPEVGQGSRQVSVDLGVEPVWSPSGDELFFRAGAGFTSTAVSTDGNFSTGELRSMFSNGVSMINDAHRAYSYDAHSDRFLMIRTVRQEERTAELILVQNFMELVKERVGS
jgi:serine/threonine-protein kinase